jgi:hypothetical protein
MVPIFISTIYLGCTYILVQHSMLKFYKIILHYITNYGRFSSNIKNTSKGFMVYEISTWKYQTNQGNLAHILWTPSGNWICPINLDGQWECAFTHFVIHMHAWNWMATWKNVLIYI